MVIGHEITHHFDNRGCLFDAVGNLRDWWQDSDAAAHKARAERVAPLYSGDEPLYSARMWRGQARDPFLINQLRTGQHSPSRYRVLAPLSHMPAFAQVFGCKAGDAMVAADPIVIWS